MGEIPADADSARRSLLEAGVTVEVDGTAELSADGAAVVAQAAWIVHDAERDYAGARLGQPTHRLLGRIGKQLARIRAAKLWKSCDSTSRERQQAAGGPGAGSTWSAPLNGSAELLHNGHWRMATLLRLGSVRLQPGLRCAMPRGGTGGCCGTPLDCNGLHSLLCQTGPSRMRPHRSVVACLARRARISGAHVDTERAIPELATWEGGRCVDAIMDAVLWWPGRLQRHLCDITIRCPHAARYAAEEDPTERASREKHRRYGDEVWPLAYTSYGRLGTEGRQFLELMCAEAREHSEACSTQRGLVASWRRDLERALLHAVADSALQTLGAKGLQTWEEAAATKLGLVSFAGVDLSPESLAMIEAKRQAALARKAHLQRQDRIQQRASATMPASGLYSLAVA